MGFATTLSRSQLFSETEIAITHLREALCDETYAFLARHGAAMTNPAMAKSALEQIDRVRTELTTKR